MLLLISWLLGRQVETNTVQLLKYFPHALAIIPVAICCGKQECKPPKFLVSGAPSICVSLLMGREDGNPIWIYAGRYHPIDISPSRPPPCR